MRGNRATNFTSATLDFIEYADHGMIPMRGNRVTNSNQWHSISLSMPIMADSHAWEWGN